MQHEVQLKPTISSLSLPLVGNYRTKFRAILVLYIHVSRLTHSLNIDKFNAVIKLPCPSAGIHSIAVHASNLRFMVYWWILKWKIQKYNIYGYTIYRFNAYACNIMDAIRNNMWVHLQKLLIVGYFYFVEVVLPYIYTLYFMFVFY